MYYGYSRKTRNIISVIAMMITVSVGVLAFRGKGEISQQSALVDTDCITVIIDAGHGGEDPGAIGIDGTFEKDLNLAFAKEICKQLADFGITAALTREDDRLLYKPEENIRGLKKISDLKNRVAFANGYENALLVSIHMNSYGGESCQGLQAYYGLSHGSRELAENIQRKVRDDIQPTNHRNIKSGKDLYLLENCTHPSVIVECGFITNTDECKKLSQKEYQKQLSFSIVCGIIEYINKS